MSECPPWAPPTPCRRRWSRRPWVPEQAVPSQVPAQIPGHPEVDLSDCGDLTAYGKIAYGTPGDDEISGDGGSDVLAGVGDQALAGGDGESSAGPSASPSAGAHASEGDATASGESPGQAQPRD